MNRIVTIDTSSAYGNELFEFLKNLDFVEVNDSESETVKAYLKSQVLEAEEDIKHGRTYSAKEFKEKVNLIRK